MESSRSLSILIFLKFFSVYVMGFAGVQDYRYGQMENHIYLVVACVP